MVTKWLGRALGAVVALATIGAVGTWWELRRLPAPLEHDFGPDDRFAGVPTPRSTPPTGRAPIGSARPSHMSNR